MGMSLSSQAETLDNTRLKDGKKPSIRDPVFVRVLANGFSPSSLTVYSGQVICWEWETDGPDAEHNVKQVTLSEASAHTPLPVPNGLCSGQLCPTGSYQEIIITPGCYYFISEGHPTVRICTVKVIAAPPEVIKVSEQKFMPEYVEISEGDSVTWNWEVIKGNLNRIEPGNNNNAAHTECFQKPGIYYFTGDSHGQMCVVKVLQRPREYFVQFLEGGAEQSFINAHVGDRLWAKNALPKQSDGMMTIKAEDGGILVSTKGSRSKLNRHPNLLSYCFTFPGIFRVTCTHGFTSISCIVLVQPKPSDYVIIINQEGFQTELGSLKQGDRLWWLWSEDEPENNGFLIEEIERMTTGGNVAKKETACACNMESDLIASIGHVGLMTSVADTPGLFTYRVKATGDWTPPEQAICSIIVKSVAKDHIMQVNDHGFQPQIVNVHPGDSVTWMWRDTIKSHNIQQVSHERNEMDDGFHNNLLSHSPDAFSHVFTELGVFYCTSSSLCSVYGAVVVTPANQVHKVEVTLHGVEPDPMGVQVGDIVCWRWNGEQLYSINAIQSPDEIEEIVKNQEIPQQRRCFARTFTKTGIHHVVATAYLQDKDEPTLHACDSFINTIYVNHAPYSCRMRVSRNGFQPHTVVLAKHDSILWYWDGNHDNKHNIVLVENPKGRAHPITAQGPSFFESGQVTGGSSFFHTFDTPGSYWVTSHGTDGKTCRIDVLNEVKRLLTPMIVNGIDGGNVELGYTVFLCCDDNDVQILYTLDGTQPVQQHHLTKLYDWQEGIVLTQPGLHLIRAVSTKHGWINSHTFTSRRFWVLCEEEDEVIEANQEREDELGLREEITCWQWFSCTPTISYFFVYDNVIHIDITLPKIADLSLIAGLQLYLNGVPRGGWLCANCPAVQVSGLAGDRIYHVVIVAFPNREDFSPQLSNQIAVSCPALSLHGGPVVSLETCNRVDAVVIVWPANQSNQYTILINGEPMGEQFSPEPDTEYCRVLFEMENTDDEQAFMIAVVMNQQGNDQPLISNEIQLSLPLPQELLTSNAREPTTDDEQAPNSSASSGLTSNEPKELLLVSELSPDDPHPVKDREDTPNIPGNLYRNSLLTIDEDKQLDIIYTPAEESHGEAEKQQQDSDDVRDVSVGHPLQGDKINDDMQDGKGREGDTVIFEESEEQNTNDSENNMETDGKLLQQDDDDVETAKEDNTIVCDEQDKQQLYHSQDVDTDGKLLQQDDSKETSRGNDDLHGNKGVNEEQEELDDSDQNEKLSQQTSIGHDGENLSGASRGSSEELGNSCGKDSNDSNLVDDDTTRMSNEDNEMVQKSENECVVERTTDSSHVDSVSESLVKDHVTCEDSGVTGDTCAETASVIECEKVKPISGEDAFKDASSEVGTFVKTKTALDFVEVFDEANDLIYCERPVLSEVLDKWQEYTSVVKIIDYLEETLMVETYDPENIDAFFATTVDLEIHLAEEFLDPVVTDLNVYTCSTLKVKKEHTDGLDQEATLPELHTRESCSDGDGSKKRADLSSQLSMDLKLAVKGVSSGAVILEWEDSTSVSSPDYCVMVLGERFNSDVDSQKRYGFTNTPTPEIWPNNQTSLEQHCWTTEHKIIEIHGLKPKQRYRIVVLMTSRDSQCMHFRSDIMTLTMPGRPKAPVIRVITLKDREFTISWRTPCCYGDAIIVGYKLLINGSQHGDLLPHDAVQHTVGNLQHGTFQHVGLIAVTRHSVGDSVSSNVMTIACPHPPPPPDISEHPTTSHGTICISWSPVSMATQPNQLRLLSSYDVFVDDVVHGSCPAGDTADIFMDSFTYTIPECIAGREYCIYVRGHVDPQMIESSPPAHMCGCYGDMSNVLRVHCGGEAAVPALLVDHMDETKVELSWDKPPGGTPHRIKGYVLRVDDRIQGNILDPETHSATLTNLSLEKDVTVTLTPIRNHDRVERLQENQIRPPEAQDSGVESGSSLSVDKRIASRDTGPSSSLTLHLWGFVHKVSEVRVVSVTCCAVEVQWSLAVEDKSERGDNALLVHPEGYRVKFWKSEELTELELVTLQTKDTTINVTDLTPSCRYAVVVEAFANHPNYTTDSLKWNVSKSEKIRFDTKPPPDPPENLRIVSRTLTSVCLSWDPLNTKEGLRFIYLDVYKMDSDEESPTDALMHFKINPHMTSYTIHSLDSKTLYLFNVRTSYSQIDSQNERQHCCGTNSSIKAWTGGVDRPRDLHVTKRTPFSLHVAWQPAVTYGNLQVLYYQVHYMEKKSKSPHGGTPTLIDGNTLRVPQGSVLGRPQSEIRGLEPGVVYNITVEAVVKLSDRENEAVEENQANDADEVASSIDSSESDWVSLIAQDCLSKSITVSTVAPSGIPVLLVTGMSATQIHLSWNKPSALQLDAEDRSQAEDQDFCGRIRQIMRYTLEVNGRVVTRLPSNKHNFTMKRCKPGMKYTCYLVVMTTAGGAGGKQNKKNEGKAKKVITAVSTNEFDSDDEESSSFQEARSEPLEVTIPRQELPLVLNTHYSPTTAHVSSGSSAGSDESDDGCVVLEWRSSTPLKGVSSYRVHWRSSLEDQGEMEDHLSPSCTSYEVYPVKQRSVYSVWLQMFRNEGSSISYGPLHCQIPGRPDSPWIWCRSISSSRILLEWNEPRTYGIDTIRAYQVNLNGRQLGKLLSPQTKKVAVHCQRNSVYRIVLLALPADPHLGDAEPSNLLTVCTPGVTEKGLDPKQNIRLQPLWSENESLTVEWSDDNDLLTVDHYVIKWSSVRQPQSREEIVPVEETSYTIEGCQAGTRHFIAVAAVDDRGKLVSKSPQLIMQTSAPLQAPRLRLNSALPSSIIIDWDKPLPMGDATVDSYEIKVNGVIRATLGSSDLSFEWSNCSPCDEYTFQIRTLSTKEDCHSEWSEILLVVCPGSYQPVISRAPSSHVNCIHVTWDIPTLSGGATVKAYKVHYLTSEEDDVTLDTFIDNPATITHGPLESTTHEDTLNNALPSLPYWVILEVHLFPDGCHGVFSRPIRTRVAVPPDPPGRVNVVVVGLRERQTLERFVSRLAQLKDRICRKVQLLQNSVVVKGSKQKEIQITKNLSTLHNLDIELKNCTQDIKHHTGSLNAEISWTVPRDDGDATVTGYQVFIDGEEHGQPLDMNNFRINLKLPASPNDHVVSVKSLTSHPIGPSAPTNQITLRTQDFLPFVQFCYFGVHSQSNGCCYGNSLSYEIKNKQISTHRGPFGKPLPSPLCHVTDISRSSTQPLIQPTSKKSRAILFWTIWCHSSVKAMEMFMEFARTHQHDIDFTTCCVQSGQPVSGHHQSLRDQLTSRDWLTTNVQHLCGCHPAGQRRRYEGGGSKGGVCHMYSLVGVPTILLCNHDGYMLWQGRICVQDYHEYQQCMLHALTEALNQDCNISNCDQCVLDHELNTSCLTSRLLTDPNECYNYKGAKQDSSLVVTGRLSSHSAAIYRASYKDVTYDSRESSSRVGKSEPTLTQDVDPSTLESTKYLRRRLQDTRPQTSPSIDKTPTLHRSLKVPHVSARRSAEGRAKTANSTRSSVFQNRFSSSMTSLLPSLELANERTVPKKQRSISMKPKRVQLSVDEFSTV